MYTKILRDLYKTEKMKKQRHLTHTSISVWRANTATNTSLKLQGNNDGSYIIYRYVAIFVKSDFLIIR